MKIEAGKFYRTRDGQCVGPITPNPQDRMFPWCWGSVTWTDGGQWHGTVETDRDIVAEWTSADAPPQDYSALRNVLDAALQQAAEGKGAERHAGGRPFTDQPIATITRGVGLGFPLGQALKKTQEAAGMVQRGERDAAERDLLGAIVYLAAAVLAIRDGVK